MESDPRSDFELLAGSKVDPDQLGLLYARHAAAVFRYLSRRVGAAAAEDLVADVFEAAFKARLRVVPHGSGSALPWLYGIAGNVVRRHLRRRPTPRWTGPDDLMDWDAVDARLDAQGRGTHLAAALAELSAGERELLLLIAWEHLTPTQAASALGLNTATARSRLHRARARPQSALDALESKTQTEPTRRSAS